MTNDTQKNPEKKRERRDRREEILQEATKLFGHHGFRGTTLSSVARAVDLTEPGLLHYFPSKVHLLQGVLEYRDQQDREKRLKPINLENISLATPFELLEGLVAKNEAIPDLVRLFTVLVSESIRSDHPSHDYFKARYKQIRNEFAEGFSKLDEFKLVSDVDLDELASLILAVMDGLQIQWLLDPESVDMSKSFNLFSKIVLGYLNK